MNARRWLAWICLTGMWMAHGAGFHGTVNGQSLPGSLLRSVDSDWSPSPVFTVGETINGYTPPGVPDGIGAFLKDDQTLRVFINHELSENSGYPYGLLNGTQLKGARISYLDLDRGQWSVKSGGLAYHTIIDRLGNEVTGGVQLNEGTDSLSGISRLCSGTMVSPGMLGFEDQVYFAGEESGDGLLYALEVQTGILHCVPACGRHTYENITPVDMGRHYPDRIGLLIGSDYPGSPLYLYVGQINHFNNGSFLDRNGLAFGRMFALVLDGNCLTHADFNGTGNFRSGHFDDIAYYRPELAGTPGYDDLGFAKQTTMHQLAQERGAFRFSRPEDLDVNPFDGTEVVFASTGRGDLFPTDDWGAVCIVKLDFFKNYQLRTSVTYLYDGNDAGGQFIHPDWGLRNPDNVVWASDGFVYVQEDRAAVLNVFGGESGKEASVWQLDPGNGTATRIAEIDRTAALPDQQTDAWPADLGNWETTGIFEITALLSGPPHADNAVTFLTNVMAHSVTDGSVAGLDLVEGGQLLLLTKGPALINPPAGCAQILSLYPVPARDAVNLCVELEYSVPVQIELTDVTGRRVMEFIRSGQAGTNRITIEIGQLPPGTYLVSLDSGLSKRTGKLIHLD